MILRFYVQYVDCGVIYFTSTYLNVTIGRCLKFFVKSVSSGNLENMIFKLTGRAGISMDQKQKKLDNHVFFS